MPLFSFKARNGRGEALTGQIEAGSPDAVATQLMNSGLTPITIVEDRPTRDWVGELRQRFAGSKPSADDLILFCRQMFTLTRAGVPLVRGLSGLAESTSNPKLARLLVQIRIELEAGRELSFALGQYPAIFTPLMISMVRVGENTGRLDEAFLQLSKYLERDRETRNRVKEALRYPTIVMVAIVAAMAAVNILVIPKFAAVFQGMRLELPWQTRLLIGISDAFVAHWPLMLGALALATVGTRAWLGTESGHYRWDRLKLRLPIAGSIILRATLGRFARAFAMTVRAGVPLTQVLTVVSRAVDNDYVRERIVSMRTGVERGESLSRTARATNLYTPLVLQMMAVGEETGAVDQMMEEVADFYEREVDYEIKFLSSAIEPVLIVAIAGMVLVLALGIIMPMMELTQLANR